MVHPTPIPSTTTLIMEVRGLSATHIPLVGYAVSFNSVMVRSHDYGTWSLQIFQALLRVRFFTNVNEIPIASTSNLNSAYAFQIPKPRESGRAQSLFNVLPKVHH